MLVGQKQVSRTKPAGSTERLGYWGLGWSAVVVVAITEAGRLMSVTWAAWEAGDDEDVRISWTSPGSERRSTSMITGDDGLSRTGVCVGLGLLEDVSKLELCDSAGTFVAARDDLKKESILG